MERAIPPEWVRHPFWWRYPFWYRQYYVIFKGVVEADDTSSTITTDAAMYRETHVYNYLLSKNRFWVSRLTGSMVTRAYFQTELNKAGVVYVTGVGHGSPTRYTGYYGSILWEVGNYASAEADGRIVHLLSCKTAQQLGPDLVNNGAKAYFGYAENFTITWAHPDAFWECDSLIDRLFADGLTADDVYHQAYANYTNAINHWLSIHSPTANWLLWDRNALKAPAVHPMFGDGNAKF